MKNYIKIADVLPANEMSACVKANTRNLTTLNQKIEKKMQTIQQLFTAVDKPGEHNRTVIINRDTGKILFEAEYVYFGDVTMKDGRIVWQFNTDNKVLSNHMMTECWEKLPVSMRSLYKPELIIDGSIYTFLSIALYYYNKFTIADPDVGNDYCRTVIMNKNVKYPVDKNITELNNHADFKPL